MSFTIRRATLYKEGGEPTRWVQVILRCDNPVDKTDCVLEQLTGAEPTNPEVAETVSAADAERQFDEIVQGWERKGFTLMGQSWQEQQS